MKKSFKKGVVTKVFLTVAMVITFTIIGGIQSKAALTAPTGLKQTDAGRDNFDVEWSPVAGADQYVMQMSQDNVTWSTKTESSYSEKGYIYSGDILPLAAGKSYYVRVAAVDENGVQGAWSSSLEVVTEPGTKVDAATIKHTGSGLNSISLTWKASDGATAYQVRAVDNNNTDAVTVQETTKTSIVLKNLKKDANYDIYITPMRKSASGYIAYGLDEYKQGTVPVKPQKANGLTVVGYYDSIKQITVECNERKSAVGYQYEFWTASNKKDKKVKSSTIEEGSYTTRTTVKHSDFKKGQFYKIRVRAYCKNDNNKKIYGAWSDWKYTCKQPSIKKFKSTKSGVSVQWETIKNADRYTVYVSTKQRSGYKKYGSVSAKKNSMVVKKCGKTKLKKGKTYYFYVVAQKKVGNKYQSGDALYCYSKKY